MVRLVSFIFGHTMMNYMATPGDRAQRLDYIFRRIFWLGKTFEVRLVIAIKKVTSSVH